jgi:hypothetical protein
MQNLEKSQEIVEIKKTNTTLIEKIKELKIVDQDSSIEASNYLLLINKAKKNLEEKRKFFVGPLNDQVKKINAMFKQYSNPLQEATRYIGSLMFAYRKKTEEEERKKNEEVLKLAEKVGIESKDLEIVEKPEPVKTDLGTVSTRKVTKWRLVSFSKLDDAYKTTNDVYINKKIREGIRQIPGLEIYTEDVVTVRNS